MNSSLLYLTAKRLKNQLRTLVRSPGKIIYIVVLLAVLTINTAVGSDNLASAHRDQSELFAGMFAVFTILSAMVAYNGFSKGASMFTMPDVNLIFTSPTKPQSVLFYGLGQQMRTSLLLGLFLLFQYSWMNSVYGVNYGMMLAILLGYALNIFLAQLAAMLLYTFTGSNDKRRNRAKTVFFALYGALAAYVFISVAPNIGAPVPSLVAVLNGTAAKLFPLSGWVGAAVSGAFSGGWLWFFAGLSLCALFTAAAVAAVVKLKQDFYEDVLKSAEISYSAITASKQGTAAEALPNNVKLGKTGIGRGEGADAFYYKHLVENRRSQLFILGKQQIIFALVVIAFSFFMKNSGGFLAVFSFSAYMQMFGAMLGRFPKELTKPYVYLVPESAYKKLWSCLKEGFAGYLAEAVIVFLPVALIIGLSPLETAAAVAARCSFSLLFTAGNVLERRVFGSSGSRVYTFFFYFVTLVVVAAPGVALGIIASSLLPSLNGIVVSMLAIAACNLPMSALILFLCRNMLSYAELNER